MSSLQELECGSNLTSVLNLSPSEKIIPKLLIVVSQPEILSVDNVSETVAALNQILKCSQKKEKEVNTSNAILTPFFCFETVVIFNVIRRDGNALPKQKNYLRASMIIPVFSLIIYDRRYFTEDYRRKYSDYAPKWNVFLR